MIKKLCLSLCFLSLSTHLFALPGNHYTIVIDAGSSGSRLHLFQHESSGFPVIRDLFSEKNKIGLSSFADNPTQAGSSLQKMLDDATKELAKQHIDTGTVSLDILATAGMRLLTPTQQKAIYDNLRRFLTANYHFAVADIKTIDGKTEGLYGWLDVNYLANTFLNHEASKGSIDMGGASTQIVFETTDNQHPNDEIDLDIADTHYHIFSKSFLNLGQDRARSIISKSANANQCFPKAYPFSPVKAGLFDRKTCENLYADFISQQRITDQLAPIGDTNFIAYSGIYYTLNFLGADTNPTQQNLQNKIDSVCTQSWSTLQKNYPTTAEKFLAVYCANASFDDQLLFETYGLKDQLQVVDSINGQEIDWTLGAVLFYLLPKG